MNGEESSDASERGVAAGHVQRNFAALQKLQSAQVAYLAEKVKAVGVECTNSVEELKKRIDELEGNTEELLSVSKLAKVKNLSVRYIRELIAQEKISALPVGGNRFKIDLRMFNREIREVMIRSSLWRQAHEKQPRRQVDFAA